MKQCWLLTVENSDGKKITDIHHGLIAEYAKDYPWLRIIFAHVIDPIEYVYLKTELERNKELYT